MLGEARRDPQRRPVAHRALGHLAQVEDEVARRERIARRGRRAGGVALAALRAGVEVEQVLGRERVDGARSRPPPASRLPGAAASALPARSSLTRDARRAGEHVHRLRERDRGDPEERERRRAPTTSTARGRLGRAVRRSRRRRNACADAASRTAPRSRSDGFVGGDAERLEQEAGEREEEQAAEEDPVAERGSASPRPRAAPPARPGASSDRRNGLQHAALDREARAGRRSARSRRRRGRASRRGRTSPARRTEAEHRLGEVVLEGEDDRPDEEHHEAVEDEQVAEAGERVAPPDPGVRERRSCVVRRRRAGSGLPTGAFARPRRYLRTRRRDPEDEDRHRDGDQARTRGRSARSRGSAKVSRVSSAPAGRASVLNRASRAPPRPRRGRPRRRSGRR